MLIEFLKKENKTQYEEGGEETKCLCWGGSMQN